MGGILGTLGSLLGGGGGNSSPIGAIVQMLLDHEGGVSGLVNHMQQGGMGDLVSSWLSNGHNLPISGDQISSILSSGQLQNLAAQFGGNQQEAADAVAQHLPNIIDKLSPDGTVPQGNDWM